MPELMEFKLPETSEDVSESVIVIWYKSEGEAVQAGEVLVEVQTEKATFELQAPVSGVLKDIRVERAGVAQVGDVLAVIDTTAALGSTEEGRSRTRQNQAGNLELATAEKGSLEASDETTVGNRGQRTAGAFVAMAPRLRRLAQELGVDPSQVSGTGAGGRVTEEDLRRAATASTWSGTVRDEQAARVESFTNPNLMRRTIAQRMMQSVRNSAQLTLQAWADVTSLASQRKVLFPEGSWNDWVLRAVVLGLREHPVLNARWEEPNGVVLQQEIHLGVAVDTEDGLMVPVIRDADKLSFAELHLASIRLSEQVKMRKLNTSELMGSTFTVTNLGAYGIEFFTPILNPPESAILGVGQVEEFAAVRNGGFEVRQRLPLSLTLDHQVVDGGPAARFLQTVSRFLAEPEQLL